MAHGGIAQLVERRLCTAEVIGSNPLISTLETKYEFCNLEILNFCVKFKELRVYGEYLGIQKR